MKRLVSLLVVLLPLVAVSRPLLVPPKHLELPLPAPEGYPGQWGPDYFGVAIDGDTVLASARRTIDTNSDTVTGVYVFQRSADGSWNYAGPLFEGADPYPAQVLLNGAVATTTLSGGFRVYERTTSGWTLATTITAGGNPIRIEDGSIYTRPEGAQGSQCVPPLQQYRKVSGS